MEKKINSSFRKYTKEVIKTVTIKKDQDELRMTDLKKLMLLFSRCAVHDVVP